MNTKSKTQKIEAKAKTQKIEAKPTEAKPEVKTAKIKTQKIEAKAVKIEAKAKTQKIEVKPVQPKAAKVETWEELTNRHREEIAAWLKAAPRPKTASDAVPLCGGIVIARQSVAPFVELRHRQQGEFRTKFSSDSLGAFRSFLAAADGDRVTALAMMGVFAPDGKCPFSVTDWRLACEQWEAAKDKAAKVGK